MQKQTLKPRSVLRPAWLAALSRRSCIVAKLSGLPIAAQLKALLEGEFATLNDFKDAKVRHPCQRPDGVPSPSFWIFLCIGGAAAGQAQ